MSEHPIYSDALVTLAKVYDRASLACRASRWQLSSLKDDFSPPVFVEGDDSLSDWTQERVILLEQQLPMLCSVVNGMIASESKPWFDVQVVQAKEVFPMPSLVLAWIEPYMDAAFHYYEKNEGQRLAIQHSAEHYVILFEGDGYLLPKTFPVSFIEIWWRRYWCSMGGASGDSLYLLSLVENPAYGWDCLGHER